MGTEHPNLECIPAETVGVLVNNAKDRLPDGDHRVFSASVRNEVGLVIFTASLTLKSGWT